MKKYILVLSIAVLLPVLVLAAGYQCTETNLDVASVAPAEDFVSPLVLSNGKIFVISSKFRIYPEPKYFHHKAIIINQSGSIATSSQVYLSGITNASSKPIELTNGKIVAPIVSSGYVIAFEIYSPNSSTPDFISGQISAPGDSCWESDPQAIALANGNFMLAHCSASSVVTEVYNSSGQKLSGPTSIISQRSSNFKLAALGNGQVASLYSAWDGTAQSVRLVILNSNGVPVLGPIILEDLSGLSEIKSIESVGSDRFTIIYSKFIATSGTKYFFAVYNSSGIKINGPANFIDSSDLSPRWQSFPTTDISSNNVLAISYHSPTGASVIVNDYAGTLVQDLKLGGYTQSSAVDLWPLGNNNAFYAYATSSDSTGIHHLLYTCRGEAPKPDLIVDSARNENGKTVIKIKNIGSAAVAQPVYNRNACVNVTSLKADGTAAGNTYVCLTSGYPIGPGETRDIRTGGLFSPNYDLYVGVDGWRYDYSVTKTWKQSYNNIIESNEANNYGIFRIGAAPTAAKTSLNSQLANILKALEEILASLKQ